MIKKIISIMCIVGIILSSLSAIAANESEISELDIKLHTLKALDIIDEEKIFAENESIKRGEFLEMLCNFFDGDLDSDAKRKMFAEDRQIICSAENFDPDRAVTYEEAVKMLVSALGFESYAGMQGGYPTGYLKVAKDIGLTKTIIAQNSDASNVITLLYNALSAGSAEATSFSGGFITMSANKKTGLLSVGRNITRIEGTVTATDKTTLINNLHLPDGRIEIDNQAYTVVGEYPEQIIGLPIVAWIYDFDGKNEVCYIEIMEKKINSMEIQGRDIEDVSSDFSYITYLKNNTQKKVNLSPVIKVIYNGVWDGSYTKNDLMPSTGSVKLVEINGDNKFDIAFVESYETMLVDYVSFSSFMVTNVFRHTGALKTLELDPENGDYRFEIIKDGKPSDLADIKKYDVLDVARSKNLFNIKVIVTSKSLQASAIQIDPAEKTVTASYDDEEILFEVADVYYAEESENTPGISKIEIGKLQNYYFDSQGRMVATKSIRNRNFQYVWTVECKPRRDYIRIKYLTDEDDWVTTKFAKKVKLNGTRKVAEEAADELGAGDGFAEQLLMIETNDDGEVTKIDTAVASDTYISNTFTISSQYTMTYRSPALYTSGNANAFYPSAGATVFLVPPAGTAFDEKNYIVVTGHFSYNKSYKVRACNADEFLCSDLFVVETDTVSAPYAVQSKFCLITGKGTKLSPDGDVVGFIHGDLGSYKNIELSLSESASALSLGRGDYIRFDIDREGRATNIQKFVDRSAGDVKEQASFLDSEHRINKGIVTKVGSDNSMVILDYGTGVLPFKIPSDCYIYDINKNTVNKGTVSDIKVGDYVAINRDAYTLSTITAIIYKR